MKRVLLKLSGEALAGDKDKGFDETICKMVADQVRQLVNFGLEVGIVIGGGNFWRGAGKANMDRTRADQIGMLATVMNCIYVSEAFRNVGLATTIMTPFAVGTFTELFSKDRVNTAFRHKKVVFFAGGTGHPYFSTDTGAVLRAVEIDADGILLAKNIDGVYDSDPAVNPDARRYDTISLDQVLAEKLQVIDLSASLMCQQQKMPLYIFALKEEGCIVAAASGDFHGTVVTVD